MSTQSEPFQLVASPGFAEWLQEQRVSLAFTTYQAGKLFLLGVADSGRLSVFERTFAQCMGLWSDGQTLWLSSLDHIWRLENVLEPGQLANGYDRLYVPQVGYVTGELDVHDLAVDGAGRVVFVNTLFGCLATVSDRHSFLPLWQPPFLRQLVPADCCHLNGLALEDGQPRYVTLVARSDRPDGWRERRADGGCVFDVQSNQAVCEGLSMPHSPRCWRDELWLLESGSGYLGTVDLRTGRFERRTFLPGYTRGLAFVQQFAVVGLSKQRENRTFCDLELEQNLAAHRAEAVCGLCVVDLQTGRVAHWLRLEGVVRELYDVVVLPGVKRPMALGFRTDEIRRTISVGPRQPLTLTE